MRYRYERPKYREAWAQHEDHLAAALTAAMGDATLGLKEELRDQVRGAGLGNRLANTWRGKTYPTGRNSLDPSSFVWTKAPKLIDAYWRGATIVPLGGRRYVAIPTARVPMKGRGKRMTPLDVEVSFNQDLILRPKPNGNILAFVDESTWRYSKSAGRAVQRKRGSRGPAPKPKLILMFTLTRGPVIVRRRLDVDGAGRRWAAKVPALISNHLR